MKVYIILYSSLDLEDSIVDIDNVYSSHDEALKRLHELVEDEMDINELSTDAGNGEQEDGTYKQWGYQGEDQWIYHSGDYPDEMTYDISISIVEREIL